MRLARKFLFAESSTFSNNLSFKKDFLRDFLAQYATIVNDSFQEWKEASEKKHETKMRRKINTAAFARHESNDEDGRENAAKES